MDNNLDEHRILRVCELTECLKNLLEDRFPFVWIRGEVTNVGRPGSGHVYFSLRDGEALLNCVWFKRYQRDQESFDPLTGEVFEDGPRPCLAKTIRDGDTLICAGRLSVFGGRGVYQLLVEMAQEAGRGSLLRTLEVLRQRLAAQGLFDSARKRPIPEDPERVAVLTAPSGAAIQDFLRIARMRGTGTEIRLYPVPVQGSEAPGAILRALKKANADGWAQVVVMVRGGGSLEDLWAFNDEDLVRAVASSRLPVLTGIGHEVDTSLCDLAADCRAATPSHAAQLLWRERSWHAQRIDGLALALDKAMYRLCVALERRLETDEKALRWLSPANRLQRDVERLDAVEVRLHRVMQGTLAKRQAVLAGIRNALERASIEERSVRERVALAFLENRMEQGVRRIGNRLSQQLELCSSRLEALNPYAPLHRGYALVVGEGGTLVRRVSDLSPGDFLRLRLVDGEVAVRVDEGFGKEA